MASKDHSLDDSIIRAATDEFMECGYQNASVRKIAQRAGLTTGALYTRYANKELLFCSLVEEILKEISKTLAPIQQAYMNAQESGNLENIMAAIRQEEEIYLQLMFQYYDQCVLLFCRSNGSMLREKMERMMEEKAKNTVEYLKKISKTQTDITGIEFVLSEQFHYYQKILEKGYNKEQAYSCMKTVEEFMEAGWKALFEKIM